MILMTKLVTHENVSHEGVKFDKYSNLEKYLLIM